MGLLLLDGHHSPQNIAFYAYGIGFMTGIGVMLVFFTSHPHSWLGVYLVALSLFHFLEYFITALYNPTKLNLEAFCIPHSPSYVYALLASIVEYLFHLSFSKTYIPDYLILQYLRWLGLSFIILGQLIRSLAMIQASTNFSHQIVYQKQPQHVLVQHGVYAYLRHPAYFGFFWRSLGMQLILLNPCCCLGYFYVLTKFFKHRIKEEERLLLRFFDEKYQLYQLNTRIGIPWC